MGPARRIVGGAGEGEVDAEEWPTKEDVDRAVTDAGRYREAMRKC